MYECDIAGRVPAVPCGLIPSPGAPSGLEGRVGPGSPELCGSTQREAAPCTGLSH